MTLCRLNQTDSCLEPLERAEQLQPLEQKWSEYFVFTFVSGAGRRCSTALACGRRLAGRFFLAGMQRWHMGRPREQYHVPFLLVAGPFSSC